MITQNVDNLWRSSLEPCPRSFVTKFVICQASGVGQTSRHQPHSDILGPRLHNLYRHLSKEHLKRIFDAWPLCGNDLWTTAVEELLGDLKKYWCNICCTPVNVWVLLYALCIAFREESSCPRCLLSIYKRDAASEKLMSCKISDLNKWEGREK